jgi:two-component system chemotaxis response regulator CheB
MRHLQTTGRTEPDVARDRFAVVARVSSAGGLAAMSAVLAPLPADPPAAVIAMQHISPVRESHLAQLLGRRTALQVRAAADGDVLTPASSSSSRRRSTCWSARTSGCD